MAGPSDNDPKAFKRRARMEAGGEGGVEVGGSKGSRAKRNGNRDDNGNGNGTNDSPSGQQGQHSTAPQTNNNNPSVPGVVPYNNPAPILTAGQPIFLHHTGTGNPPNNYGPHPTNFITLPNNIIPGYVAMSGYVNPPNTGIHFQPQVPDTTNGPYVHTYVPRHDQHQQPQTVYVPAVGANVCLPYPRVVQQPVTVQQPVAVQQPVVYQMQIPVPAAVCQPMHYYASGASSLPVSHLWEDYETKRSQPFLSFVASTRIMCISSLNRDNFALT